MEACQQKWYYDRKIGAVNLKPGDLILVKEDAFKGKRRSRIGGKKRLGRWCIKLQLMSPLQVMTWKVMSPPPKLTSHLHQRLAFPCVWAAVIHGTGVPAPPHARLPLQEVKERGHYKRIMVRQSPNNLPVKLPWGEKWEVVTLLWTSTRASTEDG